MALLWRCSEGRTKDERREKGEKVEDEVKVKVYNLRFGISDLQYNPNPDAFVYLKVDKSMKKVFVNEIEYIENRKDYVEFFLTGGKSFLVKQLITAVENLLSEHKFMRVHRSYMISLSKISGYNAFSIQLGKKEIPEGRLYKQQVMERLQER